MRWLKALAAAAGLLIGLVGIPAGLLVTVGNPWPAEGVDLAAPLTDNAVIGLLAVAGWVLWVQWAACVVAETISTVRARHRDLVVPATFTVQQQLARMLVGAIVVMFVAGPTISNAAEAAGTDSGMSTTMSLLADSRSTDQETGRRGDETVDQTTSQHTTAHPTVTVGRGDTLWVLAATHLGDGMRWSEIAEHNEGQTMIDGTVFHSARPIVAGWQLAMPSDAVNANTSADQNRKPDYTVQAGDTLSEIAETELGDASAWPQIAEASADITQPGGHRLTDPDHIEPGWQLHVNSTDNSSQDSGKQNNADSNGSTGSSDTGSSQDSQDRSNSQDSSNSKQRGSQENKDSSREAAPKHRDPEQQPAAADTEDHAAASSSESETAWPVRTSAGIGAVLAAGLIGILARRRRQQRRNRPTGAAMPIPSQPAQRTEIELRSVAGLDQPATVDVILRALASHYAHTGQPLPTPQAGRLTDETVELYLTEPASLPEPWTSVGDSATIWETPLQVPENSPADGIPAPWPSLVTLGHDDEQATVMANIEALGAIGVTGDAPSEQQILTAMAVELATSPWASELTVTLVGDWPDLTEIVDDRMRYVPTLGDSSAVDGPEVLLLADPPAAPAAGGPASGNTGIVHPGPADGGWTLQIDQGGTATVQPSGLRLDPQQLPADQWSLIAEALQTATITPGGPQPVADQPTEPTETASPPEPTDTHDNTGGLGATTGGKAKVATAVLDRETPVTTKISEVAEEAAWQEAASHPTITGHPIIRVMTPTVRINEATGNNPGQHERVCTRIAAFLALNPNASRQQLIETIWPNRRVSPATVKTRISQLRAWLGYHPDTGEHYLPSHQLDLSSDVRTDWDIFTTLTAGDPASATTPDLEAALSLPEGRPFEGEEPQAYAFAEFAAQHIITDIVDAAEALAQRHYANAHWRGAQEAAALGVQYEPGTERLWRIWIQAAHAAHNPVAVDEAIDRMTARITELGFDLEPETRDLITSVQLHEPMWGAR